MDASDLFTDQAPHAACGVCLRGYSSRVHRCPRKEAIKAHRLRERARWLESLGSADLLEILVDLKEENRRLAAEVAALRIQVHRNTSKSTFVA